MTSVLAQTPQDTSSDAIVVYGMIAIVGILSIVALFTRARRSLLPLMAALLGLAVGYQTFADWIRTGAFSVLTVMGLLLMTLLVLGGLGALREGIAIPQVEGVEPSATSGTPRSASKVPESSDSSD